MITGEETLEVAGACCQACTVEMLNEHEYFDVAVVDECQMVADPYRGHNWTRAVLGLRAEVDPSVYGSGGGRYYRADDQTVWGYL